MNTTRQRWAIGPGTIIQRRTACVTEEVAERGGR